MLSRNLIVLIMCQAFGMTAAPVMVFLGGIIGTGMAPDPRWATLPIVIMVVGTASFVIPAAMFMKKFGRKAGFILSALMASFAGLLAVYSLVEQNYFLFCLAALLLGGHMTFVVQYRFAAAESVDANHVGKAVSIVMLSGVFAAWLGPQIATSFKDASSLGLYTGSFLGLSSLMALTAFIFLFYQNDTVSNESFDLPIRPISTIIKQPLFIVASLSSAIGFGVMSFIMTATPISMHVVDGISLDDTALVIQSHIVAMYLPSIFVGQLMERFGILNTMLLGVAAMLISISLALFGNALPNYLAALIALGIGWNFLFIGGTTLLTHTYLPHERFNVQATNDFFVFGFQAIASLASGVLMHAFGWSMIQYLSIPFLMITILLMLILYDKKKLLQVDG